MKRLAGLDERWGHQTTGEVVLLDNRDSFVFNLAHRFAELGAQVVVVRSDKVTLAELIDWQPAALVVSPGPGHPDTAGISVPAVSHFTGSIPILGICLGLQAIVCAFGGTVAPNDAPMHGKSSPIDHDATGIFAGLADPFVAGRYHSLVAREPLPATLRANAHADGFIMGVEHREHPTFGVQFHPESVLTPDGLSLLGNFLRWVEV
ncbi:MAG: anthranilate synthase component II [Persicimonas sp.]